MVRVLCVLQWSRKCQLNLFAPLIPSSLNPVWATIWIKRPKDILISHRLKVIQRKALTVQVYRAHSLGVDQSFWLE